MKLVKFVCWFLALLVLLAALALLLARVLVTPERVRQAVIPISTRIFDRPAEIGKVEIDLFSGIALDDLLVRDKGGRAVLKADRVMLRYRLLPLLSGRLVIDQVGLERPVARLLCDPDGHWKLAGMAFPGSAADEASEAAGKADRSPPDEGRQQGDGGGLDLLVRTIALQGGRLDILDRHLNSEAPYKFSLKDLSLTARNLSLTEPFQVDSSVRLGGGQLTVSGTLDPQRRRHELQVHFTDIDLAPLAPYFRDYLPGIFSRARLEGDLALQGDRGAFALQGEVNLEQVFLQLDVLPKTPIRNASLQLFPRLKYNVAEHRLSFDETRVRYNQVEITLQGLVERLHDRPRAELQAWWQDQELRDLLGALPEGTLPQVGQLDAAGRISGTLELRGLLDDPMSLLQAGSLTLDDVQANLGRLRPALSGTLNLVGQGLAGRDLSLRLGDDMAQLSLAVRDIRQRPLQLQSRLSADRVDFDRLFAVRGQGETISNPAIAPDGKTTSPQGTSTGAKAEIGPFVIPLVADGSLRIDKVRAGGLEVEKLGVDYHLSDNQLQLHQVSGQLGGGTFSETGSIDFAVEGLGYQGDLQLQAVPVAPLLALLAPGMEGELTGKLSLQGGFAGRGLSGERLLRNLKGEGKLELVDGFADGTKLSRGLVALLGLDQLRKITIAKAAGQFHIADGVAHVKGTLEGKDLRMAPEGMVRSDGRLDLSVPTRLAPRVAADLGSHVNISRLLQDDQGWTVLPLKIEGDVNAPKVSLDSQHLGRMAEKRLLRKLEEKLDKKLGGSGKSAGESVPAGKLLEDALRGLLGQ